MFDSKIGDSSALIAVVDAPVLLMPRLLRMPAPPLGNDYNASPRADGIKLRIGGQEKRVGWAILDALRGPFATMSAIVTIYRFSPTIVARSSSATRRSASTSWRANSAFKNRRAHFPPAPRTR
jgi:hypothetical protein